jgi:type II secretion system protein C
MTQRFSKFLGLVFPRTARGRSIVLAASVAVTLAALFVDGFPPASWTAWLGIKNAEPVRAAMVSNRVVPGRVTVTMPKPRGNDSSASLVPLPLILVSTRLGTNNREGFADIGVDAGSPQTYAAGALLANGARLTEVYADHVVLERDGKSVDLYLQGHGQSSTLPDLATLLEVGGIKPTPAVVQAIDPLTEVLRPSPVFKGAALAGLEVYPGRDEETFLTLGLQPGDIIVSIDSVAVTNAEKALTQLHSLALGSALSATIRRGRTLMSISLDGAALQSAAHRREAMPGRLSGPSTST